MHPVAFAVEPSIDLRSNLLLERLGPARAARLEHRSAVLVAETTEVGLAADVALVARDAVVIVRHGPRVLRFRPEVDRFSELFSQVELALVLLE